MKKLISPEYKRDLQHLLQLARRNGASQAVYLPAKKIAVEAHLAKFCQEPRCENYGMSLSCPPHVPGPEQFQKWQRDVDWVVAVRLEVPANMLFSNERYEVMGLLHALVAEVEMEAKNLGYHKARAFAGGSCKMIFCQDYPQCQVLSGEGKCRNPGEARPSMSGFGIHVAQLIKDCGWDSKVAEQQSIKGQGATSWVAGIILIG